MRCCDFVCIHGMWIVDGPLHTSTESPLLFRSKHLSYRGAKTPTDLLPVTGFVASFGAVAGDLWYDIFVNCNCVATRWQVYNTHLHTNNSQNDTKQTIHRTTQQFWEQHKNFGWVWAVPRLGELYPGICLTTEEKARKTLSQVSRTIRMHSLWSPDPLRSIWLANDL
jgi:hypothetical protein